MTRDEWVGKTEDIGWGAYVGVPRTERGASDYLVTMDGSFTAADLRKIAALLDEFIREAE